MKSRSQIPFNRPHVGERELAYVQTAVENGHLSGNGPFARRCENWLEAHFGSARALMTPSCSAALELAMLLLEVSPGDEVIMPSYTFVSTANAVALRGAVPVFVDIRADTLNLDEGAVEAAITARTKAIIPVHYAGVGCEMRALERIAERHGLAVVEDAAHAVLSRYDGRPLGGIGQLGALSFHETKNVHCGEGGALLVNEERLIERAEILQEKGTDRARFFRGHVDKYTWVDLGASYLLSDVAAAFLFAQLEEAERLTERRREIWTTYHAALEPFEAMGAVRRPVIPPVCEHNAHLYYLLLANVAERDALIRTLAESGIYAVFHYVPLHSSPAGRSLGRAHGSLPVTDDFSDRLVRLPLWVGMKNDEVARVVDATASFLEHSVAAVQTSRPRW